MTTDERRFRGSEDPKRLTQEEKRSQGQHPAGKTAASAADGRSPGRPGGRVSRREWQPYGRLLSDRKMEARGQRNEISNLLKENNYQSKILGLKDTAFKNEGKIKNIFRQLVFLKRNPKLCIFSGIKKIIADERTKDARRTEISSNKRWEHIINLNGE